jgi:hypothetical protein
MSDPLSDSVNDVGGARDPEFTPIAICTGTDMDGRPVTILDRLCLNRPAVETVVGDMKICQQEAKMFRAEAAVERELGIDASMRGDWYQFAALTELFVIIMVCLFFMARLARR